MIVKLLANIKNLKIQLPTHQQASSFVISKMFKKLFDQKKQKYQPKAQTYNPESQQSKNKQPESPQDVFQVNYDFFARQKQIQLNKDYRKIREQSQFIPQDVGKGGFDQVVYWSQFAKTPQQIIDLVKVFNRIPMPQEISDKLRFQQFGENVMKIMYLSSDFNVLQQFATFGEKFSINQPHFWQKIQQKTVRLNPKTPSQIKDCIQIAFIMSKMRQGQIIYSSLFNIFKQLTLTPEDRAKLLLVYANTETGQRNWVQQLMKGLIENLTELKKQILVEVLTVFKKSKNIPDNQQKQIFQCIQNHINDFNFRELCLAGGYIPHGKLPQSFWTKLQHKINQTIPNKKSIQSLLLLLQLLTSYSMSTDFVRKQFVPLLRFEKHKFLHELPPQILSTISKTLFIYQLENQTKDIQEIIQTIIIKTFNYLKNVEIDSLIKVLKDYTVTRIGSRQLYIFLQEVANAMFMELKKNRQQLETICALYEKSELCTPQFLQKLQSCL